MPMTPFTKKQILFILDKINNGKPGYGDDEFVSALQAKLSILLQIADDIEQRKEKENAPKFWMCCGVTRPIEQRCSCGEGADG